MPENSLDNDDSGTVLSPGYIRRLKRETDYLLETAKRLRQQAQLIRSRSNDAASLACEARSRAKAVLLNSPM